MQLATSTTLAATPFFAVWARGAPTEVAPETAGLKQLPNTGVHAPVLALLGLQMASTAPAQFKTVQVPW